jgi:GxxExxY protein
LVKQELHIEQQFPCPIVYEGLKIDGAFRLDLLLEKKVVLEIKAVERILPVHGAQLLSYLKLGNYKLGFLLNFNVVHMKDGIKRIVNNL